MTEEKRRITKNRKVFKLRVEVGDADLREALVLAADERMEKGQDPVDLETYEPIGADIVTRNEAIHDWLEAIVRERIGIAQRRYAKLAVKRAQEAERKALEEERQKLREYIDENRNAEKRVEEIGVLLEIPADISEWDAED